MASLKKYLSLLIGAWLLLFTLSAGANDGIKPKFEFKEGEDYTIVEAVQGMPEGKSIVEFFSYSCPHCYRVNGVSESVALMNKAIHKYIPASLGKEEFQATAVAFYVKEMLKLPPEIHEYIFNVVHVPLGAEKEFNKLYEFADVQHFYASIGIEEKKYREIIEELKKLKLLDESDAIAKKCKVAGTPTFIVNNKYKVAGFKLGLEGRARLEALLTYLVTKK